jgi:hypothetical protein
MQELKITEVGEITIKKLSKRDWEIIRNKCLSVDSNTKEQRLEHGTYTKYLCVLGITKAPFFKSEYLENSRLDSSKVIERENEYYDCPTEQKVLDIIAREIEKHNAVDDKDIKEVGKEQSNI